MADSKSVQDENELLRAFPQALPEDADTVRTALKMNGAIMVVLDDDPTGTQAVHDVVVLTSWSVEDFLWAFTEIARTDAPPAVFVETNSRSLDPTTAAACNSDAVRNALVAAKQLRVGLQFVSRSDSTLRGHFPLETNTITNAVTQAGFPAPDGVLLVLAFPEAGRVTIGGVHYLRQPADALLPAGESEYAADATFGYTSSRLADYVAEKSARQYRSPDVVELDLSIIRSGPEIVAQHLRDGQPGRVVVADIVVESDLLTLAHGFWIAQAQGTSLLPRCGPSFVRALLGQRKRPPLTCVEAIRPSQGIPGRIVTNSTSPVKNPSPLPSASLTETNNPTRGVPGGLIVVGSHVGTSTRQLAHLCQARPGLTTIELPVAGLLSDVETNMQHRINSADIVAALQQGDVAIYTSRQLVTGTDPATSLDIARRVSEELTRITAQVVDAISPRFIIAKGGITSSDLAVHGLRMRRAIVRGCLLPGIISLWQPVDGPGIGVPYIVFAGNVGDDNALAEVVDLLSATSRPRSSNAENTNKPNSEVK